MSYFIATRVAVNNHRIKAVIHFKFRVLLDKMGGDLVELTLFGAGNSFFRGAEFIRIASLHLNKHNVVSFPCDDINFTPLRAKVSHQYRKSLFDEVLNGDIFSPFAEFFSIAFHRATQVCHSACFKRESMILWR